MHLLKTIIAMTTVICFAPLSIAQEQNQVDHSQMKHGEHDHDHTGQENPDLNNEEVATSATIITAKVNGLVCDFCAQALKKVFKKQEEVESLNVDLNAGLVEIALKEGRNLDDELVKSLIRSSGYSLVSLNR